VASTATAYLTWVRYRPIPYGQGVAVTLAANFNFVQSFQSLLSAFSKKTPTIIAQHTARITPNSDGEHITFWKFALFMRSECITQILPALCAYFPQQSIPTTRLAKEAGIADPLQTDVFMPIQRNHRGKSDLAFSTSW